MRLDVVEVVSTNWRDDYHNKFGDYEEMGIPEYWIERFGLLKHLLAKIFPGLCSFLQEQWYDLGRIRNLP